MKTYKISITSPDGTCATCYGIYSDCFAAVMAAIDNFPTARRISARRLP
jgi:hypothetical protein